MADESEFLKLPTEQKLEHKVWKARVAGYEELIKIFGKSDEKSPEFSKYHGYIKKLVCDSNAIAQEKAMEAVVSFMNQAPTSVIGKVIGEVSQSVITKCFNATRAKTKERGMEVILLMIEAEKPDIVQEELLKGLESKQPKVVIGCVQALREALRVFGSKTLPCKPIIKQVPRLLEDRDKTVRDETKTLTVEIYHWIGPPIKPQLQGLKPVQLTELEAEFEKLAGTQPRQTRFMRSQQELKEKMETASSEQTEEAEDEEDGGQAEEMDPLAMVDAVDIIPKLPTDFLDKLESKKWQERKESLEALQQLIDKYPKLETGDYNDVLRMIKKVVAKDTNILLVSAAAKIIAGLAKGLRQKFSTHAPGCIDIILEKFREKKPAVVANLIEAVDACYQCTNLDSIQESVIPYLDHKTPSVKAETAQFIARCFTHCSRTTLPKKTLKAFCTPLLKLTSDTAPEVREGSFNALGTAMKVVEEKNVMPFLGDIDAIRLGKIKEYEDKAVLLSAGGKAKKAAAPRPVTAPAAPRPPAPKAVTKSSVNGKVPPKKKLASTAGKGKKAVGTGVKGADDVLSEAVLPDEAVEEMATNLFSAEAVSSLESSNWKERLAAVEKILVTVKSMPGKDVPTQCVYRLLVSRRPGLKDNNFQVLKLKLEILFVIAKSDARITKQTINCCVVDLVEKISDTKNGAFVKELLSTLAESTKLQYVSQVVMEAAFAQKNPKTQQETMVWLTHAITEFGLQVNLKSVVVNLKIALVASNPAVRTGAVTVIGVLYKYMGPQARILFQDEKPAQLTLIDAEIEKVSDEKPPPPSRGQKAVDMRDGQVAKNEEVEDEEEEPQPPDVADLLPRIDISEQVTPGLLENMSDKNWKIRNEALQKISSVLTEAKFVTTNLGELPQALLIRMTKDSNKMLVLAALSICQTLAQALGRTGKQHFKTLAPGLITNLGDSKPQVRQQAVVTLDIFVQHSNLPFLAENDLLSDALKMENPNLRIELLGWLADKLPTCKKMPQELKDCIPYLFNCLEDRNGQVRQKAQDALGPFMMHTGYDPMLRQANKMKPASKDQVLQILEKYRAAAAAAAPAAAPVRGGGAKKAPTAPDLTALQGEDDEPAPRAATAVAPAGKGRNKPGMARKGSAPAISSTKKKEEEDTSPPMKVNRGKEQRFKDEKALKILKWNFTTPGPEFVQQLRAQLEPNFSKSMVDLMFHHDFKFHLKAIDILHSEVSSNNLDATKCNLDIVLKWMTLRFYDTNTSVLLKCLEYLASLVSAMSEIDYQLQEQEAQAFLPHLIVKVGDPKDNVRKNVQNIFSLVCKIYPASKLFSFLVDGLKSKNSKQRAECLEHLAHLIHIYGISVCQPSVPVALKTIAQQISDRDNSVRSSALNTIVEAYLVLNDQVFKYIGKLSDKEKDMLEERIRRCNRVRTDGGGGGGPSPSSGSPNQQDTKAPVSKMSTVKTAPGKLYAPAHVSQVPERRTPARRTFHLDLEDDGEDVRLDMPKLVNHDDLDELLNKPVALPPTKFRTPSPKVKRYPDSRDARGQTELVINQVASTDIRTALTALSQVQKLLNDPDKVPVMVTYVDQILAMVSMQLRLTQVRPFLSKEDPAAKSVLEAYRQCIETILPVIQKKELSTQVSGHILKDMLTNMLTVLLDQRLADLHNGPQIVRSINQTVVRIVEKVDPTIVLCTLTQMMYDCVAKGDVTSRYLELLMKCMWKMIRLLPACFKDINLNRVLKELHTFLLAFPMSSWANRAADTPLRTIKTTLHSLAKLRGTQILTYLTEIEETNSEIETYLRKVLRSLYPAEVQHSEGAEVNGGDDTDHISEQQEPDQQQEPELQLPHPVEDGRANNASPTVDTVPRRMSKNTHDQLAEIFRKIGSKENTREGLKDLYEFKLKYPSESLDPFLRKSSKFFQDYIEQGLRNIRAEREEQAKVADSSTDSNKKCLEDAAVSQGAADASAPASQYMDRLRELRQRCGLEKEGASTSRNTETLQPVKFALVESNTSQNAELGSNNSLSSSSSSSLPTVARVSSRENIQSENSAPSNSNTVSVEELKRRLDRIKGAQKQAH